MRTHPGYPKCQSLSAIALISTVALLMLCKLLWYLLDYEGISSQVLGLLMDDTDLMTMFSTFSTHDLKCVLLRYGRALPRYGHTFIFMKSVI